MRVDGSHVVITGASRGIGAAVARECAARGARVTLVARSGEALSELARELNGTALRTDLGEPEARRGLINAAEDAAGPVDVLVNNAGVDGVGDFLSIDADTIERLLTLNAMAPIELTRQALPGMIDRGGGHILNVSSFGGVITLPGTATYAATKAALSHFTDGLRSELRGLPVGLTLIEVPVVDTALGASLESHGPFAAAHRRYRSLRLTYTLSPELVARAGVDAVESARSRVRLSRRGWLLPALAGAPRRLNELVLSGVQRRDHP